MNEYDRFFKDLESGPAKMKAFGNSMTPKIKNGSTLTYQKVDTYEIGDVVCCKVKGRMIKAHLITQKDETGRYMISNNHGRQNGWTRQVDYARKTGKGIVFENLKFRPDYSLNKKRNRMFSNFCYRKILELLEAKCIQYGIAYKKVIQGLLYHLIGFSATAKTTTG